MFFTDYPFTQLGDIPNKKAPIREIEKILAYDGDKYVKILVDGIETEIKSGYIYKNFSHYDNAVFAPLNEIKSAIVE